MLKKLFILSLIAIASVSAVEKASAISVPEVVAENTLELCSDLIDNDGDETTDEADADCASFVTPEVVAENTLELCSDLIDNDGDETTDEADADCASFVTPEVVAENTLELCSDLIDNDGDETTDEADADCASFVTPEVVDNGGSSNNGGSSSGSRARSSSNGGNGIPSTPSVLGATTGPNGETLACAPYLTTFMKIGKVNNVTEVKKLQTFLNEFNNAGLPVTGFFGTLTDKAVKDLQAKYSTEILAPWGANTAPTGYVYKMTQWFINVKKCPDLNIPKPVLN